jgi:hypothetical protein
VGSKPIDFTTLHLELLGFDTPRGLGFGSQPFGDQWVKSFVNTRSYLDAHPPPPDKPKSIAPLAGREANPKPFAPPRLFAEKVDNPLTFAPPVRAGAV